jgi:predicted transcriptional regulator
MSIYDDETVKAVEISKLPVDVVVDQMIEPVSNKARMMILKALTSESRSFSALSEMTRLRGGNLLFHIQKLLDGGLIIQRHDRGDYMITKKGFILMKQIGEAYQIIQEMENGN